MNISIEDLSYNDKLDQEAMQAVAGSGIFSDLWKGFRDGFKKIGGRILRVLRRLPFPHRPPVPYL